jgi:hypothetical protein
MKLAKSSKLLTTACALALAMGVVRSAHADHRSFPHGPKFSVDVETFCGDPYAVELDEDGEVLNTFNENVAVRVTDVSDDNGPADAEVGLLTIKCTAAVKQGRAKPAQVEFATIEIPEPGFGVIDATCPLGSLPAGATEWKARAEASGGDVRRPVSDNCEEVPVP